MPAETLIIGAGISGLSCAYHLEAKKYKNYLLLEASSKAGGLCGSYTLNGFTFDYSGHLLHIASKYGLKLTQKLLGKNVNIFKRKAIISIYGTEVPFPFQNNLYGLDEKIVSECVKGALESYKDKKIKDTTIFTDWAMALYGAGICKHFMLPYNKKLWQTDLTKLTSAWCGKFVPSSTLEDIIKGAYTRRKKEFGYNTVFFYPKSGGCQTLCDALLKKAENITYNTAAEEIDLKTKTLKAGGKDYPYKNIISTMPLPELGKIIKDLPAAIKKDFKALKNNTVFVLNLGVSGKTKEGHWYYFPEEKYPFYRIGVQSAFSAAAAPKNTSSFYIEFGFKPGAKPDTAKLKEETLQHLKDLGFIEPGAEILAESWLEIPAAYPIYDTAYAQARQNIIDYLAGQDIYLLGRYGAWEYSFMEKSLLDGADTADKILKV